MKRENTIQVKSYQFALRVVKLYKYLIESKKEFVLSKQILRSGTSIGANVEEAIGGQSKADFIAKLQIALKESRETHYWIRLLIDSKFLDKRSDESILIDCEEILKLLNSILKSSKSK
ncbi:MAG: four helix bundle protein [Ignavibacteriota bacterium]|nr:four helix bundle protein [Ignavibacteriota bacterium]MCO6446937.1 four helix bundle protein [Ignavibacterium album]MCZ2267634.1 four helix bundle protein [Ignavibacteriales bacterium]QKJ99040.1 MAG: four helix bundle protein [Ignavibacteriota bacterium]HOJ06985.1 four helix bundle protein [Ignavibacteriaceae bacterium]